MGLKVIDGTPTAISKYLRENENKIDAKIEQMLLFQILEEHTKKDKKDYQPCQDCIRLGINKGFKYALDKQSVKQEKK